MSAHNVSGGAMPVRHPVALAILIVLATSRSLVAAEPAANDVAARAQAAEPLAVLLRDPGVRSELQLTASQVEVIDKVLADVDYPLWYVRDATDAQTQMKCARAFDHLEKNVGTALQPKQRSRLDGILLQSHGWPALLIPRFSAGLELSADQQSRLRNLLKPDETGKNQRKTDAAKTATEKQILPILTAAQQAQLPHLMGPPFDAGKIRLRYCLAPAFEEVAPWINSQPLTWDKLRGQVVAVHFWAFNCINCSRNLPHYQAWHERYAGKGLVIVGLHTPESAAERVVESVRAKVRENKMTYPVGIDGAAKTWQAWSNRCWPSVYLVDKQGYVRYWRYGELNWQGTYAEEMMRGKIEELLAERD
jgi:thiol-disulfide isomerase/thioredoxin